MLKVKLVVIQSQDMTLAYVLKGLGGWGEREEIKDFAWAVDLGQHGFVCGGINTQTPAP